MSFLGSRGLVLSGGFEAGTWTDVDWLRGFLATKCLQYFSIVRRLVRLLDVVLTRDQFA